MKQKTLGLLPEEYRYLLHGLDILPPTRLGETRLLTSETSTNAGGRKLSKVVWM